MRGGAIALGDDLFYLLPSPLLTHIFTITSPPYATTHILLGHTLNCHSTCLDVSRALHPNHVEMPFEGKITFFLFSKKKNPSVSFRSFFALFSVAKSFPFRLFHFFRVKRSLETTKLFGAAVPTSPILQFFGAVIPSTFFSLHLHS